MSFDQFCGENASKLIKYLAAKEAQRYGTDRHELLINNNCANQRALQIDRFNGGNPKSEMASLTLVTSLAWSPTDLNLLAQRLETFLRF